MPRGKKTMAQQRPNSVKSSSRTPTWFERLRIGGVEVGEMGKEW